MSRLFKDTVDEMRMISCPAQIPVAYITGGSVYHGRLPKPAENSPHFRPFKAVSESPLLPTYRHGHAPLLLLGGPKFDSSALGDVASTLRMVI